MRVLRSLRQRNDTLITRHRLNARQSVVLLTSIVIASLLPFVWPELSAYRFVIIGCFAGTSVLASHLYEAKTKKNKSPTSPENHANLK